MFCLTPPLAYTSATPPGNLGAPQFLSYLLDQIKQKRITLHKKDDPSIEVTIDKGVLQFKSGKSIKDKMSSLLRGGLSKREAADILFTPQNVMDQGIEWQNRILADHESHLQVIASRVRQSLFDHAENPVARQCLREAAVGVADVPLLFPYVKRAPAGGAVVIIPRGLIIIPMWFAALRRLPRPWNELPLKGEPLKKLLGTAGIAVKAMLGETMVGTNSYMFELLHSEEMKIGMGGGDYEGTWVAAPELAEFGKRHETTLCERFVIAHELAHVALGHPEIDHAMLKNSLTGKKSPERIAWLRRAELEADKLGLQVLLDLSPAARSGMMDGHHVFNGHQIVDALLVLCLLFHVVEDHEAAKKSDSSHPPAETRLRQLLETLVSNPEGKQRFFAEIYPQMKQDLEVLDEMLGAAIALGKPKVVSHPDARMRWFA